MECGRGHAMFKNLMKRASKILEKKESKISESGGVRVANLTHTPQDDYSSFFSLFGETHLLYPTLGDGWKFEWVNKDSIQSEDAGSLYKNIIRYFAPVNRAYNHWRRSIISSYKFIGTTPQMQAYIDNSIDLMEDQGQSLDTQLEHLASYGYWAGALFGEIEVDENTGEFIKLSLTNPFRVRFRPREDDQGGFGYELGIYDKQNGDLNNFRSLDGIPTVYYQVLYPGIDVPYAHPPVDAAVFWAVIFTNGILDYRKSERGQAHARTYAAWDMRLFNTAWTPQQASDFIKKQSDLFSRTMNNVAPEEAVILPGGMTIIEGGSASSHNSVGIEELRKITIQQLSMALNVPPSILASNEGTTESFASFNFRDLYKTYASLQEKFENFMSVLWTRAANLAGVPGEAVFLLERNDEFEEERQAQIELTVSESNLKRLEVAEKGLELGVISREELRDIYYSIFEEEPTREDMLLSSPVDERIGNALLTGTRQNPEDYVRPTGANTPLLDFTAPTVTNAAIEVAIDLFNDALDQYEGLLEARASQDAEGNSDWYWDEEDFIYYNEVTEEVLTEDEKDSLSDVLIDRFIIAALSLSLRLASGEEPINGWLEAFREEIFHTSIAQFLLGRGGRYNLSSTDEILLSVINLTQFEYLQGFAESLLAGELTEAQLLNRTRTYIEASTNSYERGKTAARDLELPEYPGDGNQICRSNCRCHWKISETEDTWNCSWTLDPQAQHCDSCLGNASQWSPLIVTKVR